MAPADYSLLYSLLATHYSLLTTHHSPLTTHYSLFPTHYSRLTTLYSLLPTHFYVLQVRLAEVQSIAMVAHKCSRLTSPVIASTSSSGPVHRVQA